MDRRYGGGAYGAQPKKKNKALVVLLIVIIAVVAAVLIWFFATARQPIGEEALQAGEIPSAAPAKVVSQLPEGGEPDPAAFSFELNDRPAFSSGLAEGALGIINPRENYYVIHVEIIDDATGDRLYSSGALNPGEAIEKDKLLISLPKGEHLATAHVYGYDPQTNEKMVDTSAGLTIVVE